VAHRARVGVFEERWVQTDGFWRCRMLGAVVLSFVLGACAGQSTIAIANRSNATVAVGPGLTVPRCSTLTIPIGDYQTARNEAAQRVFDDESWLPPGAVELNFGVDVAGTGPAITSTLIVSSVADPRFVAASVPADELPECGGVPRVPGLPIEP
jgi:hypothetical protein